ncbi:MAG: hypothetical protein Q4F41_15840 [Eubacteriales bacterium]|nr:hypothetical protein [Eubacteriales bacterium]
MELHCLENRRAEGYTTFGGCWNPGQVRFPAFTLRNVRGDAVPVQSKPLAFWPDGSVKWSAHTADAGKIAEGAQLLPAPEDRNEPDGHLVTEGPAAYYADTGALTFTVPKASGKNTLAEKFSLNGQLLIRRIFPVFVLERHTEEDGSFCTAAREHQGLINSVSLEENGPLQAVFCFHGYHVQGDACAMPFVLRMYLWKGSPELKFVHTFLFDGKESRDFLKGMGIRFETALDGTPYERHIQYLRPDDVFHEAGQILDSWKPRLSPEDRDAQLHGTESPYQASAETLRLAAADLPIWNHYHLLQDSAFHYRISKRTKPACCWLSACEGKHSPGVMAVSGNAGGFLLGIRDFWQKYPGGLAADGLGGEKGSCTAWFYSPMAAAFDFRHYDTRSYPQTCYEGFADLGASAYGIGVTSECRVMLTKERPGNAALRGFAARLAKPPLFAAAPAYYHARGAFGAWSLPGGAEARPAQAQLESALARAFDFYQQEVEHRSWYGLFDYGDVMHTYDPVRHTWKYDVGGYAWQNTELVPTYWLWLYFLRTGREDVFTMAEAMSRHTSEVDVYHFGPLKGLGSRHNVRHWGCSCKEPRIAMAGHHRFLFYLTGDARLGDVMEDVLDADLSMSQNPHSRETLPDGRSIAAARSGPDWSSYVSNWMTHYERTLDETYRKKIETGMRDIANTPYGLASGPDYYYDPATAHLIYHGEIENTPNQHLQICMGGPQIWLETADLLQDDTLKTLLIRLGKFYYLPAEEKAALTNGQIRNRPFSWPMFAAAVSAYSACAEKDAALARQTWEVLMDTVTENVGEGGFHPVSYVAGQPAQTYPELPAVSTNWVAQWCLNVILCLEFIPDALPEAGFPCLS